MILNLCSFSGSSQNLENQKYQATLDYLVLGPLGKLGPLVGTEYQVTLDYLVLGPLGKLGCLVRTVHLANLG